MKYEKVREGLVEIFNSFGYEYKMFDSDGKGVSNPFEARYFFVDDPNMMFIVDNDENKIEFHKTEFNFKTFKKILNMVRKMTMKYFVNLKVASYNKAFRPKDFSTDIRRRRSNTEKKYAALEESTGKNSYVEDFDNVSVSHTGSRIVMSESGKGKILIPSSLNKYVPYLQESYKRKELNNRVIENLLYLVTAKKSLDDKAKHGKLNESQQDLYNRVALQLKKIYL